MINLSLVESRTTRPSAFSNAEGHGHHPIGTRRTPPAVAPMSGQESVVKQPFKWDAANKKNGMKDLKMVEPTKVWDS